MNFTTTKIAGNKLRVTGVFDGIYWPSPYPSFILSQTNLHYQGFDWSFYPLEVKFGHFFQSVFYVLKLPWFNKYKLWTATLASFIYPTGSQTPFLPEDMLPCLNVAMNNNFYFQDRIRPKEIDIENNNAGFPYQPFDQSPELFTSCEILTMNQTLFYIIRSGLNTGASCPVTDDNPSLFRMGFFENPHYDAVLSYGTTPGHTFFNDTLARAPQKTGIMPRQTKILYTEFENSARYFILQPYEGQGVFNSLQYYRSDLKTVWAGITTQIFNFQAQSYVSYLHGQTPLPRALIMPFYLEIDLL